MRLRRVGGQMLGASWLWWRGTVLGARDEAGTQLLGQTCIPRQTLPAWLQMTGPPLCGVGSLSRG